MSMAAIKVLHAADLHLDGAVSAPDPEAMSIAQTARRESLARLVGLAKEHGVKLVLLAGDVFDTPNPPVSTGLAFSQACQALCRMGARVFISPGNHDPWRDDSFWQFWTPPEGVTVFTPEPGGVALPELGLWVAGAAFGQPHVAADLAGSLPDPPGGLLGLACQHCDPLGADPDQDGPAYAPVKIQTMAEMGYSYWALGHLHKPQVLSRHPLIVMAGSPQGAHLGECGPHGAHLLEIEQGAISHEFAPLAPLDFYDLSLDNLEQLESALALAERISGLLDQAGRVSGQPACVRLTLNGPSPLWRSMWGEALGDFRLELKDALGLEGLVLKVADLEAPLDPGDLGERKDVLGYFWNLAQRCEQEPAFLAQVAGELKSLHPSGSGGAPEEKVEYLRGLLGDVRKLALRDLWLGGEE